MTDTLKWMLSADQQIPYHDKRSLDLWFKVMKWFKPDVVDYLGDQSDQACFSRWNAGSSAEFLNNIKKNTDNIEDLFPLVESEEKPAREFYEQTRKMLPNAEIFCALGNHDIRVFDYIDKKAPDLLSKVTPESLWGLDSLGIDYIYYNDLPKHRYGDIYVHHGMSVSKHAGEAVKNDVLDLGISLIRGHDHKMGTFFKTMELRGETLRGYQLGHMCDEKSEGMSYTNIHNWQKGFAIAHIESGVSWTKDGYWPHIQMIEISPDYTCMINGRLFSA
jgi:hypothetical protein